MGRNLSVGVILVALVSTICGLGMTGVSSWVLHRYLQARKNPTLATATDLIHQVNTFFGGTTGLYDLDVIFRILISCSATALVGGGVQFITSFCMLMYAFTGKMKRGLGILWIIVQLAVMFAIGGAFLCVLTNELEMNNPLRIFLGASGADLILILISCVVMAMSNCQGGGGRRDLGSVHYDAVAAGPKPTPQKQIDIMYGKSNNNSSSNGGGNGGGGNIAGDREMKRFNGVKVFPNTHSSKV